MSFSLPPCNRSRAINRSSASVALRSLLPIAAAAVLVWVLAGMATTRLEFWHGPTVIGQYDREPIEGPVSRRGPRWRGFVRYRAPDDWPVAAGQPQRYDVLVTGSGDRGRAVGSDTQLKLSRATPHEAIEWSFNGFWALPLVVAFFGAAVVLTCAAVVPAPAGGSRGSGRRMKSLSSLRPSPRAARIAAWAGLAVFVSFFIYPPGMLLVLSPLFFAMTAPGLVELPYRMARRLAAAPGSGFGGNPRPGPAGLIVDLLQQASLWVVLAGFCAASVLAFSTGLQRLVGTGSWSSGAFNTVRTLPWLPQDFDQALCAAADRQDAAATAWLVAHGARPRVVCAAGTPPVTPAMRFDHPALPPSQAELDALLYSAVESAEPDAERVSDLLARGANPDAARDDRPVLVAAAWNVADDVLKRLLDAGADPDRATRDGNTVLTDIVGLDRPDKALEYLPLLIARGGNLNHRGEAGRTVLLQRCADFRTTDLAFLEALMDLGADPNLADASGRTALDYLDEQRAEEAIAAFEARGARRSTAARPRDQAISGSARR
ncbi:MAG TPA: hypothetical protein VLF18_07810 [Tahibacter sp.]|uniref:ankyrin repeat domain-containing protein n=1 Tax=Tahibacter sp. TaxID=2056211 RepID=UPI002C531031|nr:hypothetical protein [Tahibacter sp.]HSX60086.1 hypothetical protein [Tahibacter sp.]